MRWFVLLLSAAALISGCAAAIPQRVQTLTFDFTEFSNHGFMFTPEGPPTGSYRSICLISVTAFPELSPALGSVDSLRRDQFVRGGYVVTMIDPEMILRRIYRNAAELGADAVTNLKIESVPWLKDKDISGVQITGFAIARERR
jgi:hypothetical protein